MNENNYTVPTGRISLFIYNWREWDFKIAWSMLTKPKQWEPVPASLPDYHCPDCDDWGCYGCHCLDNPDCKECFRISKLEEGI